MIQQMDFFPCACCHCHLTIRALSALQLDPYKPDGMKTEVEKACTLNAQVQSNFHSHLQGKGIEAL